MKFSLIYQSCSDTLPLFLLYDGPRFPYGFERSVGWHQASRVVHTLDGTRVMTRVIARNGGSEIRAEMSKPHQADLFETGLRIARAAEDRTIQVERSEEKVTVHVRRKLSRKTTFLWTMFLARFSAILHS